MKNGDLCSFEYDLINIASSIAGFFYFNQVERLEETIPKFTLRAILNFLAILMSLIYLVTENYMLGINSLTTDPKVGVFGWVYSMPILTIIIIVVGIAGWLFGNFSRRQISNVLFLEPLVGQYLAIFFIKIDVAPPIISI